MSCAMCRSRRFAYAKQDGRNSADVSKKLKDERRLDTISAGSVMTIHRINEMTFLGVRTSMRERSKTGFLISNVLSWSGKQGQHKQQDRHKKTLENE